MPPVRVEHETDAIEQEARASEAQSLAVLVMALVAGGAVLAVSALLASL